MTRTGEADRAAAHGLPCFPDSDGRQCPHDIPDRTMREFPMKTTGSQLAALLLLTTALTFPATALAQDAAIRRCLPSRMRWPQEEPDEDPEISIPGGDTIIVTGRINRDPTRNSTQVISVLSSEQIARTGEGDIAGALGRVTGLSVQGAGYRLCARAGGSLFAGAAQRPAAAQPGTAEPGGAAGHFPHQRRRLQPGAEDLFGQFPGRIRRRRDQSHHPRRAG